MRSPEQNTLYVDKLPVETKRTFVNVDRLAREKNTNIGIGTLFTGVFNEMGVLYFASVLQRNGIKIDQFTENLKLTIRTENINKAANAKPRITDLCEIAIRYALDHATSKRIQELLPSDLLLGITRAAEDAKMADLLNQQATAAKLIRKMEKPATNLIMTSHKKDYLETNIINKPLLV